MLTKNSAFDGLAVGVAFVFQQVLRASNHVCSLGSCAPHWANGKIRGQLINWKVGNITPHPIEFWNLHSKKLGKLSRIPFVQKAALPQAAAVPFLNRNI